MKVYLVVDSYQYDGGFTVEAAFLDPDKALIEQQRLRREARKQYDSLKKRENATLARLEAIHIQEIEAE